VVALYYRFFSMPRLLLGMSQIHEPVFIQAFITEFSDEAFDKGIIRRLSRQYVFSRDSAHCCPLVKDRHGNSGPLSARIRSGYPEMEPI